MKPEHQVVEAPAMVFASQDELRDAFKAGELDTRFRRRVRFQGPRANGMPELHKLTPPLGVLQDRGFKVALVTDGRMSGASGKVPAAIHVTPEAAEGGPIARIRDRQCPQHAVGNCATLVRSIGLRRFSDSAR